MVPWCRRVLHHGLEGVVAKKRNGIYRPVNRGWTKVKNPTYSRREHEIAQTQRRRERATTQTGLQCGA